VVGDELAIEQGEMADLEPRDEPGERDLRRVGRVAEHRFAEKGAPQLDPVKAADEIARPVLMGDPAFDRMGVAGVVQVACRLLDRSVDPRLLAVGAGEDDGIEGLVGGHGKASRTNAPGKRARAMELVEREDGALARLDPENVVGVAAVGHWEDARGVTAQQEAGIERPAHTGSRTAPW
jgi:hypothetical protein